MEYVSSDTNVWIDFQTISRIDLPFMLPYQYIMCDESIKNELINPPDFQQTLYEYGLIPVELAGDEFFLAESYGPRFPQLSIEDRIALAIAKVRNIVLLTGDGHLRKAAKEERVPVMGTIGILDQLYDAHYIDDSEFEKCLRELERFNGGAIRLPKSELTIRIQRISKKKDCAL